MKLPFEGIIPATFTPLTESGSLNLRAIDEYVDLLERENINDIFGTAGEGCSLSIPERQTVAEYWLKSTKGRIKNVVVHVGACNLIDTQTLAAHAQSIGATAIATLPSFYYKPTTPKAVAMYLAEVANAAPKTPLMYYHIPAITGVNVNIEKVFEEVEKIDLPSFAGVKYTGFDMCDFGRCVERYGEKYSICYGYDEQCSAGLLLGCQSVVGSTYNIALKLYRRLFDASKKLDVKTMRQEQFKAQKMISFLISVGFDAGLGKALMLPLTGIDFGPPRLPLTAPTKEKLETVVRDLKEMGLLEWNK